jgi:hypothetical protein
MITKYLNGYSGYGYTEEEAIKNCKIISLLTKFTTISMYEDVKEIRNNLSPWHPKENTLFIRGIGYITFKNNLLDIGNVKEEITSLFEVIYKALSNRLDILELLSCSIELEHFIDINKIPFNKLNTYNQILLEDIFISDDNTKSFIVTDKYTLIIMINKIGIKRNSDEYYYTCLYKDENDIKDIIYYISYINGYENIDKILEGVR